MNTYYIVRHGKTLWNTQKRTQGQKDSVLTDDAIKKAHILSNHIKETNIDKVYSSDLKRASDTAKLIRPDSDIILEKGFREINFGLWEGMTIEEITGAYPELYTNWQSHPEKVTFLQGESILEAYERVQKTFWEIDSRHHNETILIVAHAMVIKLLIVALMESPINKIFNIIQTNLSLNIIKTHNKKATIVTINSTEHLKDIRI